VDHDAKPHSVVPSQPLTQVNLASAPMAAQSEALAFDRAEAADNRVLNEAIWKEHCRACGRCRREGRSAHGGDGHRHGTWWSTGGGCRSDAARDSGWTGNWGT
jgi:hypothetical protein